MKLSKAKKLFKAGEIQLSTHCEMNTNQQNVCVNITGVTCSTNTYYRKSKFGIVGDGKPFTGFTTVNLSDIKPSKKKSLKKKVKELKQDLIEAHEVIDKLERQLNYFKNHKY